MSILADGGNSEINTDGKGVAGFATRVLRYFQDFIQTDFRRQKAPRRRITLKNDAGFRMGIPLRKYRTLYDIVAKRLCEPVGQGFEITVPKGRFTSPLSPTLRDLIKQQVAAIPDEEFVAIRSETLAFATRMRADGATNAERYSEGVAVQFIEEVGQRIVSRLLAILEEPFKLNAYSAVESVYDVEADLTDSIATAATDHFPPALNTVITTGDLQPLAKALEEFFDGQEVRQNLIRFFEEFSTADVFLELRDLENTLSTSENQALYLYVGDIRFGTTTFPLFYIPLELTFTDSATAFVLRADPHLYVNKRALDWIAQEVGATSGRTFVSPAPERILYLAEVETFAEVAQRQIHGMARGIDLATEIDFKDRRLQKAENASLRMSTSLSLAVFDRSDESILSDYEALLTATEQDSVLAQEMFQNIVKGMILEEPHNADPDINRQWESVDTPDRLIAESPIPLNEEQRKIQIALQTSNCRYIIVQGPPGTGKSHTISAIAFDAILRGQSILILSDKTEALDVVEDKLAQTLEKVRHEGGDFPNPILRLGKNSTYPKLMASATLTKIKGHHQAQQANANQLDEETKEVHADLREKIARTIGAFTSVTLPEIDLLHKFEQEVESLFRGHTSKFRVHGIGDEREALANELKQFPDSELAEAIEYLGDHWRGPEALFDDIRQAIVVHQLIEAGHAHGGLTIFSELQPNQSSILTSFIAEFEDARWPIFGYLFSGGKVREIARRLAQRLPCQSSMDLHERVAELRDVVRTVEALRQVADAQKINPSRHLEIYRQLRMKRLVPPAVVRFGALVQKYLKSFANGFPVEAHSGQLSSAFRAIRLAALYSYQWEKISMALALAPSFDFVRDKQRLETLYAARMSREIDGKFVNFVENNRALARSLGDVIKAKKQFPVDEFDRFGQAFPCIIAGIREYAEYVPLKHQSFDIVVIDEASQVSLAQAFPALLRGKRIVVFGDERQFSNVKSQQASKERNATYLTDLEAYFRRNVSSAADRIQRLKQFDVKNSVLDFFKLIANAEIMLKKHFRGYQELISFSSQEFYGGELQAIKVRSKSLSEVLRFKIIQHDGRTEKRRNSNSLECEFILGELKRILAEETTPPTVGVITPFREQQELLSRVLMGDADSARFMKEMHLKIMTFDTCQGEERELIIYSMVATSAHDALNYVFPVSLEQDRDRIEDALKVQRLNVGFSRAEEGMLFVLSRPIGEFRGSIGVAIRHYESILQKRSEPKGGPVESPMEEKVKDWLQKTAFFQKNMDRLELFTAFPIGNYLKQLDKNYRHPAYRTDFLLTYFGDESDVRVIIEYDGFAEHFVNREKVTSANYEQYYKASDIERQFVIESYGYKFLRINRFNLGDDPVSKLSERLFELVNEAALHRPLRSVEKIMEQTEGLASGESKVCSKCEKIKVHEDFYDPGLAGGKGGYGRICAACKAKPKASSRTLGYKRHRGYGKWR